MATGLQLENLSRKIEIDRPDTSIRRDEYSEKLKEQGGDGASFIDALKGAVDSVNQQQQQADRAVKELVAGRSKNIHETMLTVERAELSTKLLVEVRNKMLEAYREIMKMQV